MFKPYKLTSTDGKTSCLAVDGGLVMNTTYPPPSLTFCTQQTRFPSVTSVDDLLVLSIGNGPSSSPSRMNLSRSGDLSTASAIGIVLDGVSETIDQMLGNAFCWNPNDYVRIQVISLHYNHKNNLTNTVM
ncbi:UNVERIFIED_CONTAM: putative inactive patatin-like protein 9 [Sesamum radiatum]|uniref:Inactive patatin-like protein 9 n=1 Tax=Sesamum radiatum TaxID=300843 RepID=A0AAW2UQR8_SESRA